VGQRQPRCDGQGTARGLTRERLEATYAYVLAYPRLGLTGLR